jgi:hypothetical protein
MLNIAAFNVAVFIIYKKCTVVGISISYVTICFPAIRCYYMFYICISINEKFFIYIAKQKSDERKVSSRTQVY